MHPSGWWIIAAGIVLAIACTISGLRNRHAFTDLWVVIFIVSYLALLLDEDLPPFGAIAYYGLIACFMLAGLIASRLSRWRRRTE
jgi:hypothetical protein